MMMRFSRLSNHACASFLLRQGCGGLYDKDGLSDERVAGVKKLAEEAVTPAEKKTHAACNDFFNKTMMQTVMDSESKIMSEYKLGSCCS